MKLLITPTSPYARKARIVILEKNLPVEEVTANPWEGDEAVNNNNPLGKIPVLLLADGAILDSRVICEFLDGQNESPRFLPAACGGASAAAARVQTKTREAVAEGAIDAFLSIIMAGKVAPDMQNAAWKNWLMTKTEGALDYFEKSAANRSADEMDMGDITLGCLLGSVDFRAPDLDWRGARPALAAWYAGVSARASFQQTAPRL